MRGLRSLCAIYLRGILSELQPVTATADMGNLISGSKKPKCVQAAQPPCCCFLRPAAGPKAGIPAGQGALTNQPTLPRLPQAGDH